VFQCSSLVHQEFRLIGWYKRSYISSALVSFDADAQIFSSNSKHYFIPQDNAGINLNSLFLFNLWLETQSFLKVENVSDRFYTEYNY
jgi:GH43 family beta-xylosidase